MDAIGGQEVLLTALQDKSLWEQTGRWDDGIVDVWFKTKLKNDQELGLGLTHEEPLTNLMKHHINSYRDLPKYVYQIQNKFRNETRSKNGMLRGREFLMKDLYSFNKSQEDLDSFYEETKKAYMKIFSRAGIGDYTFETFASGGIFSKYSHEFQAISESGEDIIYLNRSKKLAVNRDVYNDEVLDELGLKKEEMEEVKAIEVGNIFKLGTKYSEPLGLKYVDEKGEEKTVVMGSYGIGCGRLMGTIVEIFSDEKGMRWPMSVAPYSVHLVGLNLENNSVKQMAEKVYETLDENNIEVIYDDREGITAGEKFADADLIGIPYRLVISAKSPENSFEVKNRLTGETSMLSLENLIKQIS
jgi:prolyl-tRNA synthetase